MPYPTRARKKRRSCSSAGKDTGPPRPRAEPSTLRSAGSEAAQADSSKLPRSSVALGEDRVATCVQTGLYLCRAGEPAVEPAAVLRPVLQPVMDCRQRCRIGTQGQSRASASDLAFADLRRPAYESHVLAARAAPARSVNRCSGCCSCSSNWLAERYQREHVVNGGLEWSLAMQ